MFTEKKEFDSSGGRIYRTLTVRTNGGTIEVSAKYTHDWIKSDTIDTDGAYILFQGVAQIQIEPFNGAEYEII